MNRENITSETAGLKNELKELIASFHRKKMDFVTIFDEKLSLAEKMEEIETGVAYEVATESDDTGKRIYSNETLRNAELQKRLKSNAEYETLRMQCDHLEKQERCIKAEVEVLERTFRVQEQIVTLVRIESYFAQSTGGQVVDLET